MSFPNILINKPIGVTTIKNIIIITIGEIIFPKNIPNLNQTILSGDNIFEFNSPKNKKTIEIAINHILISPLLMIGYRPNIKKNIKNTIPKLLFEPISECFS